MRAFRRLCASAAVAALALASGPAHGHGGTVHTGMTTEALQRLREAADTLGDPQQVEKLRPATVSAADWLAFVRAAATSLRRLEAQAGGAAPLADKLGKAANIPDHNDDDIHVYVRPTNTLLVSVPLALTDLGFNTAAAAAGAVVVLPIVCACDCILSLFHIGKHKCSDCVKDTKNLVDKVPEPSDIAGLAGDLLGTPIVNWTDTTRSEFTGLPHFLNMRKGVDNMYDDHQGMYYPQAGPDGKLTAVLDDSIMAIGVVTGWTINPDKSNMVAHYEISDPDDATDDGDSWSGSYTRTGYQWRRHLFSLTPMTPLDNLALYGWRNYRDAADRAHDLDDLGYPLHAFGDATVPMHVTGTTGWGHRPYEDAYGHLWDGKVLGVLSKSQELAKAADYYTAIRTWRSDHPSGDVPVRLLVRDVAKNTLDYTDPGFTDWPYNDGASTQYQFGSSDAATATYENMSDAADLARPLFEDGIGAIAAFLAASNDAGSDLGTKQQPIMAFRKIAPTPAARGARQPVAVSAAREPVRRDAAARDVADDNALAIAVARFVRGEIGYDDYRATIARVTGSGDASRRARPRPDPRREAELRARLAGMKVMVSPKCAAQDSPEVPVLRKLSAIGGVRIVVLPSKVATTTCPVFFDVALQKFDQAGKPTGAMQRIVLRSNEGAVAGFLYSPSGQTLTFTIDDAPTGSPSRDAFRDALQVGINQTIRWKWRARALNANGIFSNWSAPMPGELTLISAIDAPDPHRPAG